tara:strand:+ start:70 stop:741 length:672 start_codon:yes stop_codon:yes gene_type:complete
MIIFSLPRTGSTAYQEMIEIQHDLLNAKEFFSKTTSVSWYTGFGPYRNSENVSNLPSSFDERLRIIQQDSIGVNELVIKIQPGSVNWSRDFIDTFKNESWIILERRDMFSQLASNIVAKRTGIFHKTKKTTRNSAPRLDVPQKLTITKKDFYWFKYIFLMYLNELKIIQDHIKNTKVIFYEDINYIEGLSFEKNNINYRDLVSNTKEVESFIEQLNNIRKDTN